MVPITIADFTVTKKYAARDLCQTSTIVVTITGFVRISF